MIQRKFHTIGQGAFYSERHENFNIVYDCGTEWKNRAKKTLDRVITQSFSEDDTIDILFISHFDYDHVSKIHTLKEHVKEIKKVVLPLLHDSEIILLCNFYRALSINILTLINNPNDFFGDKTEIIFVKPSENSERPIENNTDIQDLDNLTQSNVNKLEIESGTKFTINGNKNWVFIPYNYNHTHNSIALINELKTAGFNTDKLKSDSNYTLDKITKDVSMPKSIGGKKLREIYDKLNGRINQNSMFLYSGPIPNTDHHKFCFTGDNIYCNCKNLNFHKNYSDRVGCVYTGDGDLNIVKINAIFKIFWDNVGTIQIPHHGDLKSFDKNSLTQNHYYCPISVGKNNSYGHPSSKVIGEILAAYSCPILITEELDSVYIEIIK